MNHLKQARKRFRILPTPIGVPKGVPPNVDKRLVLVVLGEPGEDAAEDVLAVAGLADAVTFVGLGHKFQMWEPERFRTHLSQATEKVRAFKRALGASGKPSGAPG